MAERGKAIIFNHNQFKNWDVEERKGSEVDERRLQEEFEKLGFEVELETDRTFKGLKKKLRRVSKEDHSDADCLVIVVMSHGNQHDLNKRPRDYSADSFHSCSSLDAFDDTYDEEEIFKLFQGDQCRTLVGKPKIFFIQACRGRQTQKMVVKERQADLVVLEGWGDFEFQSRNLPEDTYTIPTTADFLIARSTFEGTKSFRDKKKGSPFIQILCDELSENNTRKKALDLETLLTNVKRKVAFTIQQMPTIYSTLTRRLYLTQKRNAQVEPLQSKVADPTPISWVLSTTPNRLEEEQVIHERPIFNLSKSLYDSLQKGFPKPKTNK